MRQFAANVFRHSAARYLITGGVCFLVDVGILFLLREVFAWPLWLATGTAFLLSFFFTYVAQRIAAFSATTPHGRSLARYAALVAINTIATVLIVQGGVAIALPWLVAKVIATCLTTVWNYFAYRFWVFADSPDEEETPVV